MSLAVKQFTAFAADSSTPWYTVQGGEAQFGHNVVVGALGSYGGGTLKLEISFDLPTVQNPLLIATLVASIPAGTAQTGLVLPPGSRIRFTLTGSAGPTAVPYVLE
jgi:hypothetical protein